MPSKIRLQGISERLRKELSELLIREVADPRVAGITVTDVTVDRELAYAEIYVSSWEGASRRKEVLAGLKSASGFLRSALAQRVDLRVMPRLRFHWDPTPEKADQIERAMAEMKEIDAQRPPRLPLEDEPGYVAPDVADGDEADE